MSQGTCLPWGWMDSLRVHGWQWIFFKWWDFNGVLYPCSYHSFLRDFGNCSQNGKDVDGYSKYTVPQQWHVFRFSHHGHQMPKEYLNGSMRRAQRRARTSWARLGCVPTGSGIGDIFPKDICRLYFVEYLFMLFFSASFDSLLELSSRLCGYVIVFDEITTGFQDVKWVVFYPLEFNSHVPNCEVPAVRKSKAATNATAPHHIPLWSSLIALQSQNTSQ